MPESGNHEAQEPTKLNWQIFFVGFVVFVLLVSASELQANRSHRSTQAALVAAVGRNQPVPGAERQAQ